MADYIDKFVKCPFYLNKNGDKNRIKCEGIIEGTVIGLTFEGSKKWYIRSFCCEHYDSCRIYRMLLEKYQKAEG
jgi:hypothetical protein